MANDERAGRLFDLFTLVERLRGPGGCPWDAEQTDDSIKMYLLEEAYEVLDAIENGTPGDVCQELGDLLFQILFLVRLAEERGEFCLEDVIEGITRKMINRHPHVFKGTKVNGPEEVAENWDRIKKREKGKAESLFSELQGIPVHLPALLRAHRLQERASRSEGARLTPDEKWDRIESSFERLKEASGVQDGEGFGKAAGDLIFEMVSLAGHWKQNVEHLLRRANRQFIERFKDTEKERDS
ncbi:MAG: nucleoside triphosphate pyrophosphohydrolase [Pseudomonadota bacterium]